MVAVSSVDDEDEKQVSGFVGVAGRIEDTAVVNADELLSVLVSHSSVVGVETRVEDRISVVLGCSSNDVDATE